MPKPHFYSGLDKDTLVKVELPMRELADRLVGLNYGVHRLLSHLIDARREHLKTRIAHYQEIGADDIAASLRRGGDELADGIEALLNRDLY